MKGDAPLDMTVALPSSTLQYIGIESLPEDFGIAMHVDGIVSSPKLEIARCELDEWINLSFSKK